MASDRLDLRRRVLEVSGLGSPTPGVSTEVALLLADLLGWVELLSREIEQFRRAWDEAAVIDHARGAGNWRRYQTAVDALHRFDAAMEGDVL